METAARDCTTNQLSARWGKMAPRHHASLFKRTPSSVRLTDLHIFIIVNEILGLANFTLTSSPDPLDAKNVWTMGYALMIFGLLNLCLLCLPVHTAVVTFQISCFAVIPWFSILLFFSEATLLRSGICFEGLFWKRKSFCVQVGKTATTKKLALGWCPDVLLFWFNPHMDYSCANMTWSLLF